MKRTLPISSCDWSKCLRGGHEQQGTLCAALTTTCWDKFGARYMKLGRHTCQTCSAHASVNITGTHTHTAICVLREECDLYVESFVHNKTSVRLLFGAHSPLLFSSDVTLQLQSSS